MPKIKTNKTAAKRFKVTGTGKITRRMSHNNHQFLHKSASQKRKLEGEPEVFRGEQKRVRRMLVMPGNQTPLPAPTPEQVEAFAAKKALRLKRDRASLVSMVS